MCPLSASTPEICYLFGNSTVKHIHLLCLPVLVGLIQPLSRPTYIQLFLRKEVIQPHLPIRLPCYDFTPITSFTFGGVLLAVRLPTSGPPGSHGVTGGVYKARERIHRGMLIHDY